MKVRCLTGIALALALALALTSNAAAEAVGTFTEVVGVVDLMKGGNLPANPVKTGDGVEPGDVVRTKSDSKAQIKFVDDTTLNIAPESRVAVEEYMYNAQTGQRKAVLEVFRGLVHTVVTRVIKAEQPDFIMKTHTGVMGIRGTESYLRLLVRGTELTTVAGLIRAQNRFKEIKGYVDTPAMHVTFIGEDKTPTVPMRITKDDLRPLEIRFSQVTGKCAATPGGKDTTSVCSPGTGTGTGTGSSATGFTGPTGWNPPTPVIIVTSPTSPNPIVTYNFVEDYNGTYVLISPEPRTQGTYSSTSPGSGTQTGLPASIPNKFTAAYSIVATSPESLFASKNTGGFSAKMTGTVKGVPGGPLTGTMSMTAATSGGTTFTFQGPVTIQPGGALSFGTTGTFKLGSGAGTTTGTWTQTPK